MATGPRSRRRRPSARRSSPRHAPAREPERGAVTDAPRSCPFAPRHARFPALSGAEEESSDAVRQHPHLRGPGQGQEGRDRQARHRRDLRRDQAADGSGLGRLRGGRPARLVRRRQARRAAWPSETSRSAIRASRRSSAIRVEFERIATGCLFTEGPLWHPAGRYLLWSDMPGDHLRRWSASRRRHHLPPAVQQVERPRLGPPGPPAGLRARVEPGDAHGAGRAHRRRSPRHHDGKELNSPNDIVCAADGGIYFTDPPYGRAEFYGVQAGAGAALPGVYRVGPDPTSSALLADDFDRPNGLCFSLDGRRLFVNDTARQHIRVFDVTADGTLSGGKVWAETTGEGAGRARRDEDRLRRQRLLLRARAASTSSSPDAACLGVIHVPEYTANFAWGDADYRSLYITASTSVYRIRVATRAPRALADGAAVPAEQPAPLKNARLVDGTGAPARDGSAADRGRDDRARRAARGRRTRPAGADTQVVDLGGRTVIPGLVEAHIHLSYNNVKVIADLDLNCPPEYSTLVSAKNAELAPRRGYTAARSAGSVHAVDVALKRAINEGLYPGPRLLAASRDIVRHRRHGGLEPVLPQARHGGAGPHRGRAGPGPRRRPARRSRTGPTWSSATWAATRCCRTPRSRDCTYTLEEVRALVEETHMRGRRRAAHVRGRGRAGSRPRRGWTRSSTRPTPTTRRSA